MYFNWPLMGMKFRVKLPLDYVHTDFGDKFYITMGIWNPSKQGLEMYNRSVISEVEEKSEEDSICIYQGRVRGKLKGSKAYIYEYLFYGGTFS